MRGVFRLCHDENTFFKRYIDNSWGDNNSDRARKKVSPDNSDKSCKDVDVASNKNGL